MSQWFVDEERCRLLAARAKALPPRQDYFIPPIPAGASPDQVALAWMVLTGICQQTRTLEGRVGGQWSRGSDYLFRRGLEWLSTKPDFFTTARMMRLDADGLLAWISDDGDPRHSTLDRVEERLRLLHGIAELLERGYEGSPARLYEASGGYVVSKSARCDGLAARLAACEAYSDPLAKKTFLLLIYLDQLGIWPLADADSLDIPVDYHIMRVFLRAGAVATRDPAARARLAAAEECTNSAIEQEIRSTAVDACRFMVRKEGCGVFALDSLLWMIGRNCCFYEHAPLCHPAESGDCPWRARCSLIESIEHPCANRCPFDGACRGSREAEFAALKEPSIETHYY